MARHGKRLKKGSRLGPYKIVRLIGEGGMGEVYEAHDEVLDRQVALKVISPQFSEAQEIIKRFMSEGQALARLNHQNVVGVYSLGEENGIHYIVMEYVDGHSLYDLIKMKNFLTVDEALHHFRQLLAGVKALHESGIIHRDIKPKNIIIKKDNTLKIVDFGIAKIQGKKDVDSVTNKGELVGSIFYVAPEIIDGGDATVKTDVWSLGVNLYEMLIGKNPFEADRWLAVVDKITKEGILFPREASSKVPEALQRIILKMCERNPARRYSSVTEITNDLQLFKRGESSQMPGLTMPQIPAGAQRTRDTRTQTKTGVYRNSSLNNNYTMSTPPAEGKKGIPWVAGFIGLVLVAAIYFGISSKDPEENGSAKVADAPPAEAPAPAAPAPSPTHSITKLAYPASNQKVWVSEKESLRFEWSGKGNATIYLEVARDRDFQNIVLEEADPRSPHQAPQLRDEGTYYWRLIKRAGAQKTQILESRSLTLISSSAPQIIYPVNQIVYSEGQGMKFYWQERPAFNQFRFQLSMDANFQRLFADQVLKENQTPQLNPPPGDYYWRVRLEESPTANSQWSEVRTLRVQKINLPVAQEKTVKPAAEPAKPSPVPVAEKRKSAPEPKAPPTPKLAKNLIKSVLQFREGTNLRVPAAAQEGLRNPPTLVWDRSKGASGYEVQISKRADFAQVDWSRNISGTKITWESAQPGKFFWRVRAVNGPARSGFSPNGIMELGLPSPKTKKSYSVTAKTEGGKLAPVSINWDSVPAASGYKVLVSDSPQFKTVKLDLKVDRNVASLPLDSAGQYHVRIAPLGALGETAGEFAQASLQVQIPVAGPAPAPAPKTAPKPVEKKISIAAPSPKLPPNGVSIVSLAGNQDPISFRWENISGAEFYRLEIATNENFSPVVHTAAVRENQTIVTKSLPKGKIFWRVRAEKGGGSSEWSAVFSFDISE